MASPDWLADPPTITVRPGEAATLAAAAAAADPGRNPSPQELAEAAAVTVAALPGELLRALHRLATSPQAGGVLLVRGMPHAAHELEPTPLTTRPAALQAPTRACHIALLAALTPLGEPFTFASLYGGRLVQHVLPVPGQENAQTSEGSGSLLAAHVEDAFTDQRCDYFGLLCLRGHPRAATVFARARDLRLPPDTEAVLRQPRFVVEPDVAHGAAGSPCEPGPVLTGPGNDPQICYDAVYQRAVPDDARAADALTVLDQHLQQIARATVLEPGDLLVLDNRRVVHGRTPFTARYDGTDRWLLRAMVTADRRGHRAAGSPRTLHAA